MEKIKLLEALLLGNHLNDAELKEAKNVLYGLNIAVKNRSKAMKKPTKKYINMRTSSYDVETVDEFDTMEEAQAMLKEYQLRNPYVKYHISQRPTNGWGKP
jgi:RNase H-fold protein (predicted Holliday junction resolvase)